MISLLKQYKNNKAMHETASNCLGWQLEAQLVQQIRCTFFMNCSLLDKSTKVCTTRG